MGKTPVRMKAVIYALSPYQQKIMPGLGKDLTGKIHHKVSDNWLSATLLLGPLVGTYWYVQNYKEQEKLAHRDCEASDFNVHPTRQSTLQDSPPYRLQDSGTSVLR